MRKSYVVVMLALAICLLINGCGCTLEEDSSNSIFNNSQSMPEYEADNRYMMTTAISFQETNTFFCGSNLTGNYLQYYDRSSGVSGVLCADPTCSHSSVECGAYIQAGATLSYYNGKLYWIAKDPQLGNDYYLWRSDLSGTNREKVKCISYGDIIMVYQPQQYVLHRGQLYMLGQASVVEGSQAGYRISLLSTPIDSSESYTTIFDETLEQGVQVTARFVQNSVYLSVVSFPEGGPYDISITKHNANDGTKQVIYEETSIKEDLGAIWVTEQGTIYLSGASEEYAYVWELGNAERIEVVSFATTNSSLPVIMQGIVAYIYSNDGTRWIEIKDLSGQSIYRGELFTEEIMGLDGNPNEYSYAIIGGDAEKIIVNLQNFTGTGLVDYTIMLDVTDNMKPTLLWSSQG